MLVVFSLSFAQAMVANTDGSAIITTPVSTPSNTSVIQDTDLEENDSSELGVLTKTLVIVGPIVILLIAFYFFKKKKRKKFREFDDQPKDIAQERLWRNAKMVKKNNVPQKELWKNAKMMKGFKRDNPKSVDIIDEGKEPTQISADEQLVRSATKIITKGNKFKRVDEDEKEKARLAIEKILEDAKLRDKPGFDDPAKSEGSVTTSK